MYESGGDELREHESGGPNCSHPENRGYSGKVGRTVPCLKIDRAWAILQGLGTGPAPLEQSQSSPN